MVEMSVLDKVEGDNGKCRVCGEWFETVKHIVSGQLAKKQYMIRHDKMGLRIHWELLSHSESNSESNSLSSQAFGGVTSIKSGPCNGVCSLLQSIRLS